MEMVGDWKPRGGVTPEEKQAEWRRLSDRAYSPLCFRSQARPAGFSFPLLHTQPLTLAHVHTYTCTLACIRAFPSVPPSTHCRAHRVVRFPPSWLPRGPSLLTSAIQPWEQLHAPFGAILFPRFRASFFPSYSCIRLRIQLILT